ncbi:YkvA family protein [Rhodoplanes roseus]|uniref:DUF1232 domain-containing protein n=1 Tax=Rhodoplanes roseus TaxID=29409 RepID=A0A327L298_9BRAD|nr:DUF1232 domain-containing protein [Rhodoplanes roseus]RAI44616.1 hypothetical protein CH341_08280 [Rhodoplanes roseus]
MLNRLEAWARSLRREAHALYIAARHPRTPWYAKVLAVAIAAYALSPIDLIPDFIPVLGLVDELLLLPAAIAGVLSLVPVDVIEESRARAAAESERPRGWAGAAIVVAVWAAIVGGAAWVAYGWYRS